MSTIAEPVEFRTLPHSLDAERAVLGAILVHQELLEDVSELRAEHFFRKGHQLMFAAILKLSEKRSAIDALTLRDALTTAGELEEAGGPAYIFALTDGIPRMSNVSSYAEIVRAKFDLREIIIAGQEMVQSAYEADDDARDVVEAAEQAIFRIAQGEARGGFKRLSEIIPGVMTQIDQWCQSKQGVSGVPSGFIDLDEITRGFQPGNLIIVGARPSMGKSSLVVNIAQHVAKGGQTVGIFSLEMSEVELTIRTITAESGIDGNRLQRGYIGERDWASLAKALSGLSDTNLFIDESPFITAFEMRARARRLKAKHGLDLLIVDYMQLMQSHDRNPNRTLEIAEMSRALKGLAKELHIPVIALSQLSRKCEERADKKPVLSDLRESGALEQDADLVMFIYRESVYNETPMNKYQADIIIGKHRNGSIGTVRLGWVPEQTRFTNLTNEAYVGSLPAGDR